MSLQHKQIWLYPFDLLFGLRSFLQDLRMYQHTGARVSCNSLLLLLQKRNSLMLAYFFPIPFQFRMNRLKHYAYLLYANISLTHFRSIFLFDLSAQGTNTSKITDVACATAFPLQVVVRPSRLQERSPRQNQKSGQNRRLRQSRKRSRQWSQKQRQDLQWKLKQHLKITQVGHNSASKTNWKKSVPRTLDPKLH